MNMKKPSMHPDLDCFAPATEAEKEYMVQMRPPPPSSRMASSV